MLKPEPYMHSINILKKYSKNRLEFFVPLFLTLIVFVCSVGRSVLFNKYSQKDNMSHTIPTKTHSTVLQLGLENNFQRSNMINNTR